MSSTVANSSSSPADAAAPSVAVVAGDSGGTGALIIPRSRSNTGPTPTTTSTTAASTPSSQPAAQPAAPDQPTPQQPQQPQQPHQLLAAHQQQHNASNCGTAGSLLPTGPNQSHHSALLPTNNQHQHQQQHVLHPHQQSLHPHQQPHHQQQQQHHHQQHLHQQHQQHHHQQQHQRVYNKSSFFTNNPNHNIGGVGVGAGGGGGGALISTAQYGSNCLGPAATGGLVAPPPLPYKAGPAYFNFSRQRYTPYYSRSFSNGSNSSCNDQHSGGGSYSRMPPAATGLQHMHQQQQHQQSSGQSMPPMHPSSAAGSMHNTSATGHHHHHPHHQPMQSGAFGVLGGLNTTGDSGFSATSYDQLDLNNNLNTSLNNTSLSTGPSSQNSSLCGASGAAADNSVTLQISNIDTSIEDRALKNYLLGKLKPLTPIMSFAYEGLSMVKIRVPSQHHAKQVVSYLHRKKIGHKRITVSYTRDSSTMEPSTLRCQVAGLLKDIPFYKLSMYKFRELFQSRFKTSISVMDLYDMKDICTIGENANEEKFISLRPELINSIENSELLGCLQLSVPYCSAHFKSGHRGWAELEIEPLPNVWMTVSAVRAIVYDLLKRHKGDIPIASLVYCVEAEQGVQIERNEAGVNLEHLISCVSGVHITTNKFGIKILSWLAASSVLQQGKGGAGGGQQGYGDDQMHQMSQQQQQQQHQQMMMMGTRYTKFANVSDPFGQISREIVELVKMSPKSTMKFSRFIPAYHNHFGKQCRVADYGYTKLIELFEALNGVVQIMGDGENRQITLTHKCQIRCFTSDILRLLRTQPAKTMPMAHLESLFTSTQSRKFEITDYGVCDIEDIMESLIRHNVVCLERGVSVGGLEDVCMVAIPKRRQTRLEVQKTCTFAGEVVELFRNSSQYSIPFEKFACSYHYNYGYQCRLSDYGFLKLTDLMEAITGVVEIEVCNDEDRKVSLSPRVAQRVFAEQLRDLTKMLTSNSCTPMNLSTLLFYHKKQFGYQMQPQSLGIGSMWYAVKDLPYVELSGTTANDDYIIICHHEDAKFVFNGYAAVRVILESGKWSLPIANFIDAFFGQFQQIINEHQIDAMNHAVEIFHEYGAKYVRIAPLMIFVLRIISVLEMMNVVSVMDLKAILNIGISDCFPYGYPNFTTLLESFADIFLSSSATITDMSEIVLNKQCLLAKNGVQEFIRGGLANFGPAGPDGGVGSQQQQQPLQPQSMYQHRNSLPGSGRLFQPAAVQPLVGAQPATVTVPGNAAMYDAMWELGERALPSKYARQPVVGGRPPGLPLIGSTALAQQQLVQHPLQMLGTAGSARSSPTTTATTSNTTTTGSASTSDSEEHSLLEALIESPEASSSSSRRMSAEAKRIADKENFYFNVMQSADFDISSIEKLFFNTSSTVQSPPSDGASSAEKATTAKDPVPSNSRLPLYERKPSDEWLLKHPYNKSGTESATSSSGIGTANNSVSGSSDASASAGSASGSGTESDTASAASSPMAGSSSSSPDTTAATDAAEATPPNAANGSVLFDPPKPDTPSSNVPFWMDPVWRHDSPSAVASKSPLADTLQITIPELKTFDGLPALDTPTAMQRLLDNNPSMFSFDF